MRLQDFSVRKRLFIANFMMVFIPFCVLVIIGSSFMLGLKLMGGSDQDKVNSAWPEKGPAPSIQFAISSIKVKLEQGGPLVVNNMGRHGHGQGHGHGPGMRRGQNMEGSPDMGPGPGMGRNDDIYHDLGMLEQQGIQSVLTIDDNIVYVSPDADANELMEKVRSRSHNSSMMLWDNDIFLFDYQSSNGHIRINSYGKAPIISQGTPPLPNPHRDYSDIITIIIIVAIVFIILLGLYLSRLLSRQILGPLSALRKASAEIRQGNLDTPIEIQAQDEFGDACRDFEAMRLELKAAREQQEKYEENRKELIAGISHDLSTPLTSMKGYASGILDGIAKTPEKQRHYVEMIFQGATTMEKLVESLFLFSKLDLGRIPFNLENVPLRDYFTDFYNEQKSLLAEKNINLSMEMLLDDNNQGLVSIDRIQFQRVIDNLIGNSSKYSNKDGVDINIRLESVNNNLRITFADNGPGVPEEDLPKLFDSFYRTDHARSNVAKGSGLGLAITKRIIDGMKGTIWAESNPSGGLCIIMELPIINSHPRNTQEV
ncbi:HAMP domain-containing sensor histidine kinase [Anaerovibrio sp. RM50]|uniref:HAMP domain-containing sensor histidine kinase n=1 Tax=Anaerovibrio sp. RM50 TaxID=1200557 RepID=UPI00068558DE|nr:HAMP domain-containing sensor histidine kinase [Anaerovibrio sp. RM50]